MQQSFIIAISGKGGVGKTSISSLLVDELIRAGCPGPILAVDGDPATTLHLALGLPEPQTTVADIRDTVQLDAHTVRSLPEGETPASYVQRRVVEAGVLQKHRLRDKPLHLMAMGRGEDAGCFCSINRALGLVLPNLVGAYPIVVIDNEGGLEHLNRYRLKRSDLFLTVVNPGRASAVVAERILAAAQSVGMELGQIGLLFNRHLIGCQAKELEREDILATLPASDAVHRLELSGEPIVHLADGDPFRTALSPLTERVMASCA